MYYYKLFLFLLLIPTGALAADWQYAGNTKKGMEEMAMFFDAESIEHVNKNTVRVWDKSIPQKLLTGYYVKHGSEKLFIKNVASKVATGYTPKFLQLPSVKSLYPNAQGATLQDAIIDVASEEYIANTAKVYEAIKVYTEIDCTGKRFAILAATAFHANGSIANSSDAKSPKFMYISPDSYGEWLLQLTCPK